MSLTHTIPSSRLALTLDEVTDDEEMDAAKRASKKGIRTEMNLLCHREKVPATVAGTAVTVAPPGMTGRRLL